MAVVISWESPSANGKKILAIGKAVVVGRGSEADLKLDDQLCSSKHLELQLTKKGKVKVLDLGSKNGVLLNGVKIHEDNLYLTDDLQIGSTKFFIVASELTERELDKLSYKGNEKARKQGAIKLNIDSVPYVPRGLRRTQDNFEHTYKPITQETKKVSKSLPRGVKILLVLLVVALGVVGFWFFKRYRILL